MDLFSPSQTPDGSLGGGRHLLQSPVGVVSPQTLLNMLGSHNFMWDVRLIVMSVQPSMNMERNIPFLAHTVILHASVISAMPPAGDSWPVPAAVLQPVLCGFTSTSIPSTQQDPWQPSAEWPPAT